MAEGGGGFCFGSRAHNTRAEINNSKKVNILKNSDFFADEHIQIFYIHDKFVVKYQFV